MAQTVAMLQAAGGNVLMSSSQLAPGGAAIHEMGTARMGNIPKDSVLNAHNQSHDVPNLFVTDGSCMTSSACQNPSLTYMALTARACRFAGMEERGYFPFGIFNPVMLQLIPEPVSDELVDGYLVDLAEVAAGIKDGSISSTGTVNLTQSSIIDRYENIQTT